MRVLEVFGLRRQTWLLALTVTISVGGCYGAHPSVLKVQVTSSYQDDVILVMQNGLTAPGSTYVYLVRPSPVAKQGGPLLGSSRGQVRLLDSDCRLLDELELSAGAYDVQVQLDGSATASPLDRYPEPGPALEPLPQACGVSSNPEPTG